jgi:T-complex protein 11
MKKDLQERAVANERKYFDERIVKGKVDLKPVIDWIKPLFQAEPSLNHFTTFSKAFVNLLSTSSSIQFPSTFLFDVPRMNNFRKDFRDLISVQLCLLLYRELSMSLHPISTPPSDTSFNTLRLEIWSLLCDLPEATKYTLASPSLAVQIALRATQHSQPTAVVPPAHLVNVAQSWIELNVAETGGKMFTLAEKRVHDHFVEHLVSAQSYCIAQTPLRGCECEGRIVWAIGTESAMWLLGERMHRVASFHWTVFGDVYINGAEE